MFHKTVTKLKSLVLLCFLAASPAMASDTTPLSIGTHHFNVEIASTTGEMERGLMFRKSLAPDAGMLFVFDKPQPVVMWMKNTLISLDMLFIDAQGTITHIAPNAKPKSLDMIDSKGPVLAVLELRGGICEKKNIKVGDRVNHEVFSKPRP